ncbi:retrotransposon protein, putative, ty1-copia subclass [Tanacetum coccineum]
MTTSSANNSVFRGFFEKQKLTGPNFIDWYRQLRIVLSIEDKLNYLEQPLPPAPVAPEGQLVAPEITAAHTAWIKGSKEIVGLMLMTMEPEIQRNLENLHAYEMLQELKTLFAQQAEQELLQTTRDFHSCKQKEGHESYFDQLVYTRNLIGLCRIIICIAWGKTVNELHAMLKLHEQTLPKNNAPALPNGTPLLYMLFELVKSRKIPPPPQEGRIPKDTFFMIWCETDIWKRTVLSTSRVLLKKKKNTNLLDLEVDSQIKKASGSLEDLEIIQEEDTHPSIDTSLNHEEDDLEIDEPQSDIIPIPALLDTKSDNRLNAMNVEMQSMKDNEVWVLVELPPNGRPLVASGSSRKRPTWMELYTPIKLSTNSILIAKPRTILEILANDVKTAFLKWISNEEVYMEQTLSQNADEPCVYLKASGSNVTFLILYVDDILIMGNSIPMLQDVKSYLGKCFAMKDLGEAAYILGIKIYRDRSRRLIGLCQSAYIEKILKRFHMENSKRGSIPMQDKLRLSKSQGASTPAELKRMQSVPYASAVGSIMYAVRCTRPDVAFAQNITSRFQQNPGDLHWTTVKNILKYLRNTKDMFLVYVYGGDLKRELRVSCYTDAGYLTDADDLKSQTGYVFVLNGGAVDWKSAKQSIFATSSAEAEYIAAFDASKEAVWVRKFISGLGVVPTIEKPINMYCDNTGAIAIANESGITKGARHFRAKVHYLREVIEFGDIKLEKVHTDDNLAVPFTKAVAFPKHSELTRILECLPSISFM